MCELSKSGVWGIGWVGWGWLVVLSDWVSFWWSADMADSPSAFPPPPLLFFSSLSFPSISISCPLAGVIPPFLLAPTFLSTHPLKPYCFTSLHSGFYGCFVLVQTHLTAGWWVPPPVIAAIYYQRRSTSHFSDFGKMVFTLDHFTDSPYNKSTGKHTQTHVHSHTERRSQEETSPSPYYTADLQGTKGHVAF